jgi:hypothetical protein
VLPNHNDARHLSPAVRSVLDQPGGADELIIVDDKSTDDSVALIRPLIAGRANACLVENPVNLGVYGAVDVGLDRSHSDWVLFLAANDFVLPGIFERARASIARSPQAGLWSALSWMVDEEGRPVRLHPSPVVALSDCYLDPERCVRLALRLGNWFTGPTLMYRREALEEAGRFDPAYMGMSDLHTALIIASRHGAAYTPASSATTLEATAARRSPTRPPSAGCSSAWPTTGGASRLRSLRRPSSRAPRSECAGPRCAAPAAPRGCGSQPPSWRCGRSTSCPPSGTACWDGSASGCVPAG